MTYLLSQKHADEKVYTTDRQQSYYLGESYSMLDCWTWNSHECRPNLASAGNDVIRVLLETWKCCKENNA